MNFLVNFPNSVPIAHFEFGELLIFTVESIIKVRDCLFFLRFLDLGHQPAHFNNHVTLHFRDKFQQFGMAILIFRVVLNDVFIEHAEDHFVDVELETQQKKRRQNIFCLYLPHYFLDESHLIYLPFHCSRILRTVFLLGRLLLTHLAPQHSMILQGGNGHPFFSIHLKNPRKKVVQQNLLLLASKKVFGFHVLAESVAPFAL